jgi:hypothetical protein
MLNLLVLVVWHSWDQLLSGFQLAVLERVEELWLQVSQRVGYFQIELENGVALAIAGA